MCQGALVKDQINVCGSQNSNKEGGVGIVDRRYKEGVRN